MQGGFKDGFLEGLASIINRKGSCADAGERDTFHSSARELDAALLNLRKKIEKQKVDTTRTSGISSLSGIGESGDSVMSPAEVRQRELADAIKRLRGSILELHEKLTTGIGENQLEDCNDYLSGILETTKSDDLDSKIRAAIVARVYEELGPITWRILNRAMKSAGIEWPQPGGLIPGASDDRRSTVARHHMGELESGFLRQSMEDGIKRMNGIVSAWNYYPVQSSWLWQESALKGVAAGMRCFLARSAIEKLKSEGPALRAKASQLIDESMRKIQSMLEAGVRSLEDAEKVVHGTNLVIGSVLPDIAWQQACPAINEAAARMSQAMEQRP